MSFVIFDEAFYLNSNPDVKQAVQAGIIKSGRDHFIQYGLKEKRVNVSPFYNEEFYLQTNPAVAQAVKDGNFASGLDHFIQFGETEARSPSALFDEQKYLQRYPDIAAAVKAGSLSSGLAHFLQFGQTEGRHGTPFVESIYRGGYPDVDQAVKAGVLKSGLEHYLLYGQYENRTAVFQGDSGINDTITGVGKDARIYGVSVAPYMFPLNDYQQINQSFWQVGNSQPNEVDVLIGSPEKDTFYLSAVTNRKTPYGLTLYGTSGDNDYALIQNFEVGKDKLALVGNIDNYQFVPTNGNLQVYIVSNYTTTPVNPPELIAILSGVNSANSITNSLAFSVPSLVTY
jgi:hypothetical protein